MSDSSPPPRPWLAGLLTTATLAYTAFLLFATHHPRPEDLLGPNPPSDKTLHFLAYAVLAMFAVATRLTVAGGSWRGIAVLAVALACFAGIDELTQPLFRRDAEPLDWVFDCVGILLGVAAMVPLEAVVRRLAGGRDRGRGHA